MAPKLLIDFAHLTNFITGLTNGIDHKQVELNGKQVSYLDAGDGETLLFIHGFGGANYMWRVWLQHLKPRYRVIAVTIPELEPTLNFTKAHYSFRTYSDWLHQFLDAIEVPQCHLLAHCTGACIAAFFASRYPERTQSLTMFSPPNIGRLNLHSNPHASPHANSQLDSQLDQEYAMNTFDEALAAGFTEPKQLENLLSSAYFNAPSIPALILNRLKKIIDVRQQDINFMLKQLSGASKILLHRLPLISAPTLLVGGADDRFLSDTETLRYFQSQIKESRLTLLDQCGHFSFQEQAERAIEQFEQFIESIIENN